jgi:hypothetical protein
MLQSIAAQRAQLIQRGAADVASEALPGDSSFFGMLSKLQDHCK